MNPRIGGKFIFIYIFINLKLPEIGRDHLSENLKKLHPLGFLSVERMFQKCILNKYQRGK
jgi:hypothetical protein